uniref:Uncharacterized protein n=1 Tax=Aplanochytrium stocchinoi TaxID=215587 RepID=A0A7S3PQQ7_9STRA|mmetsp:Transcript_8079/g.10224  ORF Transcript_8079/g.10224 Transcript_8079/m.10224 type:complete len:286 (+) Transcript_8079:937-1794(+)|eukprot:CAMPEP_0204835040 /NCGR_PEP_ID=MMETSP1346-20131115/21523_1 /ASSEMBLY_ACC=CAM_ASM_000771 /TAXON_ID=215587 /ORGANISM="Aplanochytrium stocchinoi, Strain GSBS06" /LENGTH=285 /DNA_ID=CAMNT_0051968739 /DNA_START=795 /DNA_END=1649 /DNA_ORIENTATION=+
MSRIRNGSSKAVALNSTCRHSRGHNRNNNSNTKSNRGLNRNKKYTWFANVLDINHTGPTDIWANRQSFTDDNLKLESFLNRNQNQNSVTVQGIEIKMATRMEGISFNDVGEEKVNANLDFGDPHEWPSLNTLGKNATGTKSSLNSNQNQVPKDFSFVSAIDINSGSDLETKFMSMSMSTPSDESGWMFLNHRQLYRDMVKRNLNHNAGNLNNDNANVESNTNSSTSNVSVSSGSVNNWTLLDNELSSASSYLSEEEDGFGSASEISIPTNLNLEKPSTSVFGFLW